LNIRVATGGDTAALGFDPNGRFYDRRRRRFSREEVRDDGPKRWTEDKQSAANPPERLTILWISNDAQESLHNANPERSIESSTTCNCLSPLEYGVECFEGSVSHISQP
jgi:hypothetical protein